MNVSRKKTKKGRERATETASDTPTMAASTSPSKSGVKSSAASTGPKRSAKIKNNSSTAQQKISAKESLKKLEDAVSVPCSKETEKKPVECKRALSDVTTFTGDGEEIDKGIDQCGTCKEEQEVAEETIHLHPESCTIEANEIPERLQEITSLVTIEEAEFSAPLVSLPDLHQVEQVQSSECLGRQEVDRSEASKDLQVVFDTAILPAAGAFEIPSAKTEADESQLCSINPVNPPLSSGEAVSLLEAHSLVNARSLPSPAESESVTSDEQTLGAAAARDNDEAVSNHRLILEAENMKLDPLGGSESKGCDDDELTPVNEKKSILGGGLKVQSDEEESSSADVWWTAREDPPSGAYGSEDGSFRAISALSTFSVDDISHSERLDPLPSSSTKRNSLVLVSPTDEKHPSLIPTQDASTLTEVPYPNPIQNGHLVNLVVEKPMECSIYNSAGGHRVAVDKSNRTVERESSADLRKGSLAKGHSISQELPDDSSIVDYLVDVSDNAEARLAARRQARAEARDIRMKELEKQQKESEENADRQYDMYSTDVVNRAALRVALGNNHRPASHSHSLGSASYHSSRRSSEESSEDGIISIRDMRHELKELEDKFRKSMVQNAQLDNEKSALTYHVELLKDKIEDLEESLTQLQRDHKDKSRDFENLKRLSSQLKDDLEFYKFQLRERDELIKEYGLVVVESEVEVDIGNGERETQMKRTLVTQETANVLSNLGDGSLDVRLKRVLEEKNELVDELRRLKLDLEEERSLNSKGHHNSHYNNISANHINGPESDPSEVQREVSKQMADYKYKVQKYEQEILALQANVSRLDGQVSRFRTAAEDAETREDDLKVEKRKLQRELREAQSRLDELETTNSHLQKRLDKLKTAKSNLLKDL